jgi:nitrous oxidase accessory protein NosD
VTLAEDLSDCPDDGLRVVDDAVLDCAGHRIGGQGRGEGILLDEADGAEVRGCAVEGFKVGIRVRAGGRNLLVQNEIVGSTRYGVELAVKTSENRLEANLVRGSGDEGIHVGSGSNDNQIVGNEIDGSEAENLYVLSSSGGTYTGNLLTGSGEAALYVKHTTDSTFEANEIHDRVVHVRGNSRGNVFLQNRLEGSRFVFEAYRDEEHPAAVNGWTWPADNQVREGAVLGAETCFQFKGASDNSAVDVVADGCKAMKESKKGSIKAAGNSVELLE